MKKLILIDGNSLIYRAFFALPLSIATSQGFVTNALYGLSSMLMKLIAEERPDGIAVAMDKGKKTFRHEKFKEYKIHRPKMPDELLVQIGEVRTVFDAFSIPIYELENYEADDLLGTISKLTEKTESEILMVTGDRDAFQLIDQRVKVLTTVKGITETVLYDAEKVRGRYGIDPSQIPDMMALRGDPSDNIPGVPGIGEKTASDLIKRFGSLESLYERLAELPDKKKNLLEEYRDQAFLSKSLAIIKTDVPIDFDYRGCVLKIDPKNLVDLFDRFEFETLKRRIPALVPAEEVEKRAFPFARLDADEAAEIYEKLKTMGEPVPVSLSAGKKHLKRLFMALDGKVLELDASVDGVSEVALSVLSDLDVGKVVYDAKKMYKVLWEVGVELNGVEFDAHLAAYLLDPSAKKYSLESILDFHNLPHPELETGDDYESVAKESASLSIAVPVLEKELRERELADLFRSCEIPLARVLAKMERIGVSIDLNLLGELSAKMGDSIEGLKEEIFSLCGEEFNINSPQQLAHVLYDKLSLPAEKKTKIKMDYSTGVSTLKKLKGFHPIVEKVLSYRELTKLKGTYLDTLPKLLNKETKRLHTTFNQTGTATGRLSSNDPNLQNIPARTEIGRKIRAAFLPAREGDYLIVADYSQIELRILAHLSGDEELRGAFNKGIDVHAATASEVFELPEDQVSRDQRRRAKAINFGIVYGMTPFGLAESLSISPSEARLYIDRYFERFYRVKKFIDNTVIEARMKGFVTTLMGRRRYLPELVSSNPRLQQLGERLAINSVIQGTAADIIKMAMVSIDREIERRGYLSSMVLQVHDELVFEVNKEELDEVMALVKEKMEGEVELEVPVIVDAKICRSWNEA